MKLIIVETTIEVDGQGGRSPRPGRNLETADFDLNALFCHYSRKERQRIALTCHILRDVSYQYRRWLCHRHSPSGKLLATSTSAYYLPVITIVIGTGTARTNHIVRGPLILAATFAYWRYEKTPGEVLHDPRSTDRAALSSSSSPQRCRTPSARIGQLLRLQVTHSEFRLDS